MNPSSPLNPYQHYRKKSPTTYEDIVDPYRRNKHRPSGSSSSEQEVLHSRTVSDSSASRLATNGVPIDLSSHLNDDPYAMSRSSTQFNNHTNTKNHDSIPVANPLDSYHRANSYLPYSHHERDPAQSITPIYVEEERQQTLQGLGSMLQDNFTMDMTDDNARQIQHNNLEKMTMDNLLRQQQEDDKSKHSPKRWFQRRWCGMARWIWLVSITILMVIFILLMYFLIPRMPTVRITDTETYQYPSWSDDRTTMIADWNVNVTLDNSNNWIPTLMERMVVVVEDLDTKAKIGSGLITDSKWLSPRNDTNRLTLPIHIAYSGANTSDETISDLFAVCGPQRKSTGPTFIQSDLFNVTFQIDLYVRGVPWSSHTTIIPKHGIQCPS